jgi:rod shape-determining protein MreC
MEGFSLWLLANHSYYQRSKIEKLARTTSGFINSRIEKGRLYLLLSPINDRLSVENLEMRNQISKLTLNLEKCNLSLSDTLLSSHYQFIPARVVNNSVNKQYNFLTLNVGSHDGIEQEMGVVTNNGIVGIVAGVSEHYSTVISQLNIDLKISAKLKNSHYFGSLFWDGRNYREVMFTEIPQHVSLSIGDTIVTSGFSAIFPPNINLATIRSFDSRSGNFYSIKAELLNDFKQLHYVWVVKNLHEDEREILESTEGISR